MDNRLIAERHLELEQEEHERQIQEICGILRASTRKISLCKAFLLSKKSESRGPGMTLAEGVNTIGAVPYKHNKIVVARCFGIDVVELQNKPDASHEVPRLFRWGSGVAGSYRLRQKQQPVLELADDWDVLHEAAGRPLDAIDLDFFLQI